MLRTAGITPVKNGKEVAMPTQPLPNNPSLENLRKQAKSLRKAVNAHEADAVARVREFHPRADQALRNFSLSGAQLVVARSHGFASWGRLKQHLEVVDEYSWSLSPEPATGDDSTAIADRFIRLACLTYSGDRSGRQDQARELLAAHPSISVESIYAAATVGDVAAAQRMLHENPALAKMRGGPHKWEPLLYAAYSRLNSEAKEHSTLEVARLLLEHGADPNAGFLWEGHYLFTALTGAFGEGEGGPANQPEHQYCYQLARLLLEAGADPNDSQSLYNRMFTRGTRHLELLFEFGLGKGGGEGVWFRRLGDQLGTPSKMLDDQMGWAVSNNHMDRVKLLVAHGVDVNSSDNRIGRPPYELALLNVNNEIAQYLLEHGARQTVLNDLDAFAAACLAADADEARSLLAGDAKLVERLGDRRAELLQNAAGRDKRDAVRLMAELGLDVNEVKRTAALHDAAISGHLDMVKLLIELGADPLLRDTEFNGTPLGWATYGQQAAVVEYLEQFEPRE
jgi:ankyrin repeat protein